MKFPKLALLKSKLEELALDEDFLYRVESNNNWFTKDSVSKSLSAIAEKFLSDDVLTLWVANYDLTKRNGTTGLILAGNIPLVGFHDILCAYFCSEKVLIKLSSKDAILTKKVLDIWAEIDHEWASRFELVERIVRCDKIIATGSNSSYNYFEVYFKKFKNILRKNRTSIAILHNNTTNEEIEALMDDIFLYGGLGCRNVSKLYIERGFELKRIFEAAERYSFMFHHSKYMNNYDYQRTLLLLNKIDHLSNNFLMLRQFEELFTPISVVNYEYFDNIEELTNKFELHKNEIQCIIGSNFIPFGEAQSPGLFDYADGVDTMEFLLEK